MFLNSLNMRFAAIGGGAVLMAVVFLLGGGPSQVIQLDFGMYPDVLEGCSVEIDGDVVGRLERVGQATRTGFKVRKGTHRVRVIHPELESEEIEVAVEQSGQKVRLRLDIDARHDRNGRSTPTITLQ